MSSSAFPINIPSEGPQWFFDSLGLLCHHDLGSQWQSLVVLWAVREEQADFVEQDMLSAKGRPLTIGQWIKSARPSKWSSKIDDVHAFEEKFRSWWNHLQPEWRMAGAGDRLERDGDDWDCLRDCSTGANGLLSVVAALYFWGSSTLTRSQRNTWEAAVDDVLYVLQQLA